MNIVDKHQLRIARQTLRLSHVGARIMGRMTKNQAKQIIAKYEARKTDAILNASKAFYIGT